MLNPPIEAVEQLSYMGLAVIRPPSADAWVDPVNQRSPCEPGLPAREVPDALLEPLDRLRPGNGLPGMRVRLAPALLRREADALLPLDLGAQAFAALPDLHDPRLLRGQGDASCLPETSLRTGQGALGFRLPPAHHADIIRPPRETAPVCGHPPIERGQQDRGPPRAGHAALGHSCLRRSPPSSRPHPRPPPLPHALEDASVTALRGDQVDALRLSAPVETRAGIGVDDPVRTAGQFPPPLAPRLVWGPSLAIPTGAIQQLRRNDRLHPLHQRLLDHPISHGGNPQLSATAVGLLDLDPVDRVRPRHPGAPRTRQAVYIVSRPGLKRHDRHRIDAGTAAVLQHFLSGSLQMRPTAHVVDPCVDVPRSRLSRRCCLVLPCSGRRRTGVGSFTSGTLQPVLS